MFLGGFLCDSGSFSNTPVNSTLTTSIELKNGLYDEVYMDSDITLEHSVIIPDWGYSTILNAKFRNNILAGNVDFTLNSISGILLKKRKQGSYKWTTIHKIPITKEEDLSFWATDITVPSKAKYTYAAVPIINGVEGTYQTIDIDTYFDGTFIIDPNNTFRLFLDFMRDSATRGIPSNIIETANSKYPYTIYSSKAQYDKISMSGLFLDLDSNGEIVGKGWEHRNRVKNSLSNRHSKIIKCENGEIWMGNIVDSIQENDNGHPENVKTSFTFVECGDVDSNKDLFNHGFSNFLEVKV